MAVADILCANERQKVKALRLHTASQAASKQLGLHQKHEIASELNHQVPVNS